MGPPAGWEREYQGRHGAEFFYGKRNLTVSVLPRYADAPGRASKKTPSSYAVRVHRLLKPGQSVPLTLGERETFEDALALAERYMEHVDEETVRSADSPGLTALADVGGYDDEVLRSICRTAIGSNVRSLVHVDGDHLEVAHHPGESPGGVRKRLRDRMTALQAATLPDDEAVYVASRDGHLAWFPSKCGATVDDGASDGTLVEFAASDVDFADGLAELTAFLQTRERPAG